MDGLRMVSNLQINELVVGSLRSKEGLDINGVLELVQNPRMTFLGNMTVLGDAKVPIGSTTVLDDLVNFGVCKNCARQNILEEVVFLENSTLEVIKKSDNILLVEKEPLDLLNLVADSLKRRSASPQVISGGKSFANPLYFKDFIVIPSNTNLLQSKLQNLSFR